VSATQDDIGLTATEKRRLAKLALRMNDGLLPEPIQEYADKLAVKYGPKPRAKSAAT
jgi:hypothetical protein